MKIIKRLKAWQRLYSVHRGLYTPKNIRSYQNHKARNLSIDLIPQLILLADKIKNNQNFTYLSNILPFYLERHKNYISSTLFYNAFLQRFFSNAILTTLLYHTFSPCILHPINEKGPLGRRCLAR
jgi:hypothetical protein